MKKAIVVFVGFMGLATSAVAQTPVAIVEDVQGNVTGVEFMDYVARGKIIKLGPTGSIVLSYMKSCSRETISGIGTVVVGAEESLVHLAEIKSDKTECDSSRAHATARETRDVAATVVRSVSKDNSITPQVTLYGVSPIVEAKGRGTLTIDRLDVKDQRQQIELRGNQLKGKFYDFVSAGKSLTPGGTYAATFGSSKTVFKIDPQAKSGATPIVGRLLRLE
ncbi:MAG TPA: hypothetical protein VK603_16300 [Candidatus Saccharimonadales bacterium]|nr:hypothetical protein [Candidatus Saccharimonadales bacterium]